MKPQDYWSKKHTKYSQEDWIRKPTIFATQVVSYFPKSGKLLDLGAGQGQDSIYFANYGYQVTAVDFAQYALDQITNHGIEKVMADFSQPLPFQPESYDIIYSHLGLHFFNVKRTQELFEEIYGILKPGGIFAMLINTVDDPEFGQGEKIENDYFEINGLRKRFFSVESMAEFASKFETILLDDHGESHKDAIKILIRFVGRKPVKSGHES